MRAAMSLVVGAFALLVSSSAFAQGAELTGVLMKKADRLYAQRGAGKAADAVAAYEKVLAIDANNIEARWKISRATYWIGMHAKGDKDKLAAYEKGIRYAQEAIKLNANCVECHFWMGVAYGKYGETKGILQSLGLVPHLKSAMETVIKLNPNFNAGGPQRVLGRLYFKLPSFKGGDKNKAIEFGKKSIELGPKNMLNYIFLAEYQLDMGKKDDAKKTLEAALAVPEAEFAKDQIPESKEDQAIAKKMYEKHFGAK